MERHLILSMTPTFTASALHEHLDQRGYCEKLREIAASMQPYHFLQNEVKELSAMVDAADSTFNVAVFGYMKTGKSSLINAYIGEPRAIVGVTETTATINKISYGDGDRLNQFVVHWEGSLRETFGMERLCEWTGTDESTLQRIKKVSYLEMFSNIHHLKDINIVDTPGMGSNVDVHEKAAKQFIAGRQADAIVYVLDVGRQSAVDSLKMFKQTCLEGTKPYNSMAVLHKWDSIYWEKGDFAEIENMAKTMKHELHDLVADVLPVSAPLALIAKVAPDDFWNSALQVLSSFEDDAKLLRKLRYDETYWATSEDRTNLWQAAKMLCRLPWPCFKVMLRELYNKSDASDASQARKCILKLSGIEAFERCLCSEFFEQRGLIRMRQLRAHAQSVLSSMNRHIHAELDSVKRELFMMSKACDEIRSKDLQVWFAERLAALKHDFELLDHSWHEFDKEVKKLAEVITYSDNLLTIKRWLSTDEKSLPFSPEQIVLLQQIVKCVLYAKNDGKSQILPTQNALMNLMAHVSRMSKLHPNRQFKQYALTLEDALHKFKSDFC